MSFNSALSPNVVKTALDDVFFPTYEAEKHPMYADATTPDVFKQETADSGAVIWEIFKGGGRWGTRAEEQDVPSANPRVTNQKTFTVLNYSQSMNGTCQVIAKLLSKLRKFGGNPDNRAIPSQALLGKV